MHPKEIRWKQRFNNFEKALNNLSIASKKGQYSDLEATGLIKTFEFTFELAWKTIKDYLEAMGKPLNYPREVLKEAFADRLIQDGQAWINMLDERNQLSHVYNQTNALRSVEAIRTAHLQALTQVHLALKEKL